MKHTLKIGTVGIVPRKSFILIFKKAVLIVEMQFPFGVFCTLLELHADTVALVGDAGFPGVDGYAPLILRIIFLFLCHNISPPVFSLYSQPGDTFQCATVFAKLA